MTIRHNCGLCVAHTLHDAYAFIKSLQHRGREATGIAAIGDDRIDVIKWEGPVSTFDLQDLFKIFPGSKYHTYFAHVRYATKGSKDSLLNDAHPQVIGGIVDYRDDHVLIRDCEKVIVHNGQVDLSLFGDIDLSLLRSGCDSEALLHFYKEKGERELLRKIPGAYTLAIADTRRPEIIILRDKTGIKPGVLGLKDGKFCVASEDIAFRENGASMLETLTPGAVYYLSPTGDYRKEIVVKPEFSECFFEWNYIAGVDTVLDQISVRRLRSALGEALAEDFSFDDVDLITFLPRCPEVAARTFADSTDIPFAPLFYKMRSERSFQGSTPEERAMSINHNLHLLPRIQLRDPLREIPTLQFLKGKRIVVIDDSIVRGNTLRRAKELLCDSAGVKEVIILSYTPPLGIIGSDGIPRGCLFGVDMPPTDDFVARNRSESDISTLTGMTVCYLSPERMVGVFEKLGIKKENLCTYCVGGKHPLKNHQQTLLKLHKS